MESYEEIGMMRPKLMSADCGDEMVVTSSGKNSQSVQNIDSSVNMRKGTAHKDCEYNDKHGSDNMRLGLVTQAKIVSDCWKQRSNLNVDKILTLFEGSREKLDYFIGLWNSVIDLEAVSDGNRRSEDGGEECNYNYSVDKCCSSCDPRDEAKCRNYKDWKPRPRVCAVDVVSFGNGGECEGESESLTSSSIHNSSLIGVNGDDGGDGSGDGEEMGMGVFSAKQTVLDSCSTGNGGHCQEIGARMKAEGGHLGDGDEIKRFPCGVHGCGQVLASLANYESHYHHCHNYVCDTCRRVFVSNFLLDVHLQENHDSYFAVLSSRIDMYKCLVESCDLKFRTAALRKDHLVSVHKFPSSFSFHQPVKSNTNRSNSKHPPQDQSLSLRSGNQTATSSLPQNSMEMECDQEGSNHPSDSVTTATATTSTATMDVEEPTSVCANTSYKKEAENQKQVQGGGKRVPASICFGRGSQRAFQHTRGRGGRGGGKKTANRNRNPFLKTSDGGNSGGGGGDGLSSTMDTIEAVDMKELADALV